MSELEKQVYSELETSRSETADATQRIYLSRHPQTRMNALAEQEGRPFNPKWLNTWSGDELRELTDKGREQAIILAKYFQRFIVDREGINPDGILVVTSKKPRSIHAGEKVRVYSQIPEENKYSSSNLDENVPREFILDGKEFDPNGHPGYIKKFMSSVPKKEVARIGLEEMQHIVDSFPDKTIIATLHGSLNQVMLEALGVPHTKMGNCSILPLDYDHSTGKVTMAGEYLANEDMEKILRGAD